MADDVVIACERDLEAVLAPLARAKRMVFFAGLPGGVTHAVIRKAVSQWSRSAVLRWDREHGAAHILIGEVPLIGNPVTRWGAGPTRAAAARRWHHPRR